MQNETIAAIATPPGTGGVAIIRISGPKAQSVLRRVFSHAGEYEHAKLYYGSIVQDGALLDTGMAVLFYAPRSYTGEDTAELHCHGSAVGVGRVLRFVYNSGASPAQPGEFSRRAFLNGKMDLTQAEAVCDYIGAVSTAGAKAGARQMQGALKRQLIEYQDTLTDVIARVEAAVEYPEEDLEEVISASELPVLQKLIDNIVALEQTYVRGRVVRDGLRVVIAGKPNVGKSSLLNALTGVDRAITSSVPGTTRDTVEQCFELNDIMIYLTDTAGIRSTDDEIEMQGANRSKTAINQADCVIFVADCSQKFDPADQFVCEQLKQVQARVLPVCNKLDLCERQPQTLEIQHFDQPIQYVSAKTGAGLQALKQRLYDFAMRGYTGESTVITNERHRDLLLRAAGHLRDAASAIQNGMDMDCVTIDLNLAWNSLGELTGNTVSEEIINRIFEKFCLGK